MDHVPQKVKLGLVGCGAKGAQVMYAPIVRLLETGRVTALMDPDPAALAYMQAYCTNASTHTDFDALLAQADIDAVIVASPVFLHCEQVIRAAAAGKHVLVEKPMARTVEECDRMIAACQESGVTLMVAFMKRFNTCFQLVKQLVEAGELGEVFQVRCEFSWHIPEAAAADEGWRARRVTWGGMFQDHGSHTVDLCRWWLGDVQTVSAEVGIVRSGREVEDVAVVTLRHTGGAISLHTVTGATHKPLVEYYLLDGTKASLELSFGPAWSYTAITPFRVTLHQNGKVQKDLTPTTLPNLDDQLRTHSHYLREIDYFCRCVQQGHTPSVTGEDGRKAIEVINAAYLSSWQCQKVAIPLQGIPDLEAYFTQLREA
jgi:predicted dehydrogenase